MNRFDWVLPRDNSRQKNGMRVVFKHARQGDDVSLTMAFTAVRQNEEEYMMPFPEYNLTLLFRQWNRAICVLDIEEVKNSERWIDV